jgi:hypothetical protein
MERITLTSGRTENQNFEYYYLTLTPLPLGSFSFVSRKAKTELGRSVQVANPDLSVRILFLGDLGGVTA